MLIIGFTVVARPDGVEFRPYAEDRARARRLICAVQDESQTVLLMGRLHYREDVLQRLRHRTDQQTWERCLESDAALASAIYRLEGVDGLTRLEGDFVAVCHDRQARRLIALRDPMGKYPLFWTQHPDGIAIGTSIRPLCDVMPSIEIDPEFTADYLAFPYEFCAELPLERTAYRGVHRLLAGWTWDVDLSHGQVACRQHWRWRDKIVPVDVKSVNEAGAMVRERLEGAVRVRLSRHAQTASHFSGGFDSTSIALLASRLGGSPVHTLSLVYESEAMLSQETEYVRAGLDCDPTLVPHFLPADGLLDYDRFDQVPLLDEPSVIGSRWNTFALMTRMAAEAGADTIMGGDGADHQFSHAPHSFVAELLGRGQIRQAWRLANRYSYSSSQSALRIVGVAARQLVPPRLRDGLRPLLDGGRVPFEQLTDRTVPPWLTADFVRRYNLRERTLSRLYPLSPSGFLTAEALEYNAGDWLDWYAGMPYGITMSRPYLDPRLLTLGVALPQLLHVSFGRMKPVLAAALSDVLPEKIVARGRKIHFGIFITGIARHQAALESAIKKAPIPDGILDRQVMLDALSKTALGIYEQVLGVGRLRVTLSYLLWLSSRDAWSQLPVPRLPMEEVCHDESATPS